jgi:hypothetical protein
MQAEHSAQSLHAPYRVVASKRASFVSGTVLGVDGAMLA